MARRLYILVLAIAMGLGIRSGALAQEKLKIGIVKFNDQPHYEAALKGVLEELKAKGFDDNKVAFDIRDGEGKKEKIAEIAQEFKKNGVNLIIPIGTPAAIEVYKEIKDIPIVFSSVFDPVGSGLAKSWESSGANITGSSTWVEMGSLIRVLKDIMPIKKLGVIYTASEKQSIIQMEEAKKVQDKLGFAVIAVDLAKSEDAESVVNSLIGKVDAIFITGSSQVGKSIEILVEVSKKAKIPIVSHLQERVQKGALLSLSAGSREIGLLAGNKAAQVLSGKNPSDIPIEPLNKYDLTLNIITAKDLNINIPAGIIKSAKKLIQ